MHGRQSGWVLFEPKGAATGTASEHGSDVRCPSSHARQIKQYQEKENTMPEAEMNASSITVVDEGAFNVWFYVSDQTMEGANTASTDSFPVMQSRTITLGGTFIKEGDIVAPVVSAVGGIGRNSQSMGKPVRYDPNAGTAQYTVKGTLFGWSISDPVGASKRGA
jgi:hypothetical protein